MYMTTFCFLIVYVQHVVCACVCVSGAGLITVPLPAMLAVGQIDFEINTFQLAMSAGFLSVSFLAHWCET